MSHPNETYSDAPNGANGAWRPRYRVEQIQNTRFVRQFIRGDFVAGCVLAALAIGCTTSGHHAPSGRQAMGTAGTNTLAPTDQTSTASDPASTTAGAGHYALRRLTNQEYTNTVQALLFTNQTPGVAFRENLPGTSGYTNDSAALDISSALVASYYAAATALASEVIASKTIVGGAYSRLVSCDATQVACSRQTIARLTKRALRRAVTSADLDGADGLMSVFSAAAQFDQGLHDVIVAVLMHPEFLTIPVISPQSLDPTAVFALDDYQVAARLSYFLWQSMPDDELTDSADQGTLRTPDSLRAQVMRMLGDMRASNLKNVLRDEFAGLLSLSRSDFTQLGQTNALRDAMVGETDAFLNDILKNDRSALTLLTGTQSFVNKVLADWYGLTFPAGQSTDTFVPLPGNRTGIGSQASVLLNTAGGSASFTNPIKRGHWISKQLLCLDPPPPPPNVPPLPPTSAESPTVRQRLDAHLNAPTCKACHADMDSMGLGAENYGPLGQWRTAYADGTRIDATGSLPGNATPFTDSAGMYAVLGASKQAKACIALQFMKLALSRSLDNQEERAFASTVAESALTEASHFSDLIIRIVDSPVFLKQAGEAP